MKKNNQFIQQRIDFLMENWKGPIPIEEIFDPYNDDQLWYPILNFNGYEVSNYGNVRSLKNFNRYPFGTFCRYKINKKSEIIYELSTNNNERVSISLTEILELSEKMMRSYPMNNYPRYTCYVDNQSRNKRMFINFQKVSKNHKSKRKPVPIRKEETFFPSFTVIQDKDIKKPIYFDD